MPNEIIARAAASESFTNNPVPTEILEEFSGNLLDFASIPYLAKNNLIGLYPAGTDIMAAVSQDWADSFEAGAIKLYGQDTVSFALSVELMRHSARSQHSPQRPGWQAVVHELCTRPIAPFHSPRRDKHQHRPNHRNTRNKRIR